MCNWSLKMIETNDETLLSGSLTSPVLDERETGTGLTSPLPECEAVTICS